MRLHGNEVAALANQAGSCEIEQDLAGFAVQDPERHHVGQVPGEIGQFRVGVVAPLRVPRVGP